MRATLAGQIARPVRFVEQVQAMYEAGAHVFVEVGPGSVLTQLTGEILAGKPHLAVHLDRKGQNSDRPPSGTPSVACWSRASPSTWRALWADHDRPGAAQDQARHDHAHLGHELR